MQVLRGGPRLSLVHSIITLVVLGFLGFELFHWTINRVYVPEGHSLMLRYKGPLIFGARDYAESGQYAREGEIGVLAQLRGPGRHFYCPVWWERKVVPDVVVKPGEVALVTSKLGRPLPKGEFIVDGDLGSTEYKGILRKVYGPGRYRVHPYGYEFKLIRTVREKVGGQEKTSGWVEIPTGYVGVVTYLTNDADRGYSIGIQDKVLPPGLYPVNPREAQVDVVEIGYRESSIHVQKVHDARGDLALDESGEPMPVRETGINFPSNDGFEIQMDFTAIWGVMPKQAPEVVRKFGNIAAVEEKVIVPQSESICRNNGSKLGAVELLVGESRQQFQDSTSSEFLEVLDEKGITLLYGLVRHIYIPLQVRRPIQQSFVADELKLTRDQEKITAKTEANLREAEQQVLLEAERISTETTKMVANVEAEGEKRAQEIHAETVQRVAAIEKQIALLDAEKEVVLGEAKADVEKMREEAVAERFGLAVSAFGTPEAYTSWQFAEGLPEEIDLKLFYAGDGTLWTDLKNVQPVLPVTKD